MDININIHYVSIIMIRNIHNHGFDKFQFTLNEEMYFLNVVFEIRRCQKNILTLCFIVSLQNKSQRKV